MLKADAKIFVAYEDPQSFSAISHFDGLPEKAAQIAMDDKVHSFSFSGFWKEQSWGDAVTAATGAEIIVVSLSGQMDLPVPVRRWMENLPNYTQENHTTLVVVFGNEPANTSKQNVLISFFQQIAENHGLDFVCRGGDEKNVSTPSEALERAKPVNLPRAERPQAPALLAIPVAG